MYLFNYEDTVEGILYENCYFRVSKLCPYDLYIEIINRGKSLLTVSKPIRYSGTEEFLVVGEGRVERLLKDLNMIVEAPAVRFFGEVNRNLYRLTDEGIHILHEESERINVDYLKY